jgi:hypothetical protein
MWCIDQQDIVGDKQKGDCLRAVTASYMEKRIEDVPHFAEEYQASWLDHWSAWMADRGVRIKSRQGSERPASLYFAYGLSPRSATNGGLPHIVIMKGQKLVHDPHPSRAGLVEITHVYLPRPTLFTRIKWFLGIR